MVILALAVSAAQARTWRISADGTGDAPTIQAGIDSAATGDSILVNPGTYQENISTLGKGLWIRGTSTPEATVIDGMQLGRAVSLDSGGGLENVTVRNGLATGFAPDGGGIRLNGLGPFVVRGNIIENNRCPFGVGGGIYYADNLSSTLLIEGNTIRANIAISGGGLALNPAAAEPAVVRDNLIESNEAEQQGGGVAVTYATVSNNLILRNISGITGGGVAFTGDAVLGDLTSNTIAFNRTLNAAENGAGILVTGGGMVTVTRNLVVDNHSSPLSMPGAGILCFGGATVSCNVLWNNDVDLNTCVQAPANVRQDPEFCAVDPGSGTNLFIQSDSPCAAGNSGGCGLIGARPVGCGTTDAQRRSWSEIKRIYR